MTQTLFDAGRHRASSEAGLANYDASLACVNNKDPNAPTNVAVGANQSVAVAQGDVVVCVFTNTRKQGSIQLTKSWSGTAGSGTPSARMSPAARRRRAWPA